ncbi:MAG: nucleotidyltransferase substrate binding protein [Bacteroidetes bacterium]|nr:nucleotidyltransferase substrate binding protein [Bacteroidota bacterium]
MHTIDTTYYNRCIATLNKAYAALITTNPTTIDYEIYRSACIKEFEIILEQSGKLLKKILKPYFHSSREVDKLYFKDLFRQAVLRSIISDETCERWLQYRDNRNNTAHDYGVNFAEETIKLLPKFIEDATHLSEAINLSNNGAKG